MITFMFSKIFIRQTRVYSKATAVAYNFCIELHYESIMSALIPSVALHLPSGIKKSLNPLLLNHGYLQTQPEDHYFQCSI